ncbi:hypothetical protein QYM36_012452 [Artemia franciscana]|uniref:Uncharacterized protein n=1 Tax=Artemia franciscana TaxID=6661 RepID=A0AA88KXJ3_ARTSF|nr:hypothetical protein QYM36_012452 [Artemia franciscana]
MFGGKGQQDASECLICWVNAVPKTSNKKSLFNFNVVTKISYVICNLLKSDKKNHSGISMINIPHNKVTRAPLMVQRLFMSNTSVDKFNAVAHQNLTTEKKQYTAKDSVKDDVVQYVKQYLLEKSKHLPLRETQCLPFYPRLTVKDRVELTVNIEATNHLANGSEGTVQALSDNIIWILLNNKMLVKLLSTTSKVGFQMKNSETGLQFS